LGDCSTHLRSLKEAQVAADIPTAGKASAADGFKPLGDDLDEEVSLCLSLAVAVKPCVTDWRCGAQLETDGQASLAKLQQASLADSDLAQCVKARPCLCARAWQ
jgi:hypothetical protein